MKPYQLAVGQTYSFLADVLRGRRRVLEVGCGLGDVARRLGSVGIQVTAIDLQLPDPTPAENVTFIQEDFLLFKAPPFDAVVFTASLHHIAPLDAAIDRAHRLLPRGGLIVADDFDLDAPNAQTLRWYYDVQELLAAAELFPRDRVDPPATGLYQRWRSAHAHGAIHTGLQMRRAIAHRFDVHDVHGAAYLYRYITRHLPGDARGTQVAQHVYNTERHGIADGTLAAVGLGIVATRT